MSKHSLIISCPVDTFSGYGARSRDVVRALIKTDLFNIRILPQRWGNTPFGALDRNDSEDKKILDLCLQLPNGQLPFQPDVWIQVTVPNEFQPVGKVNIGITAGIETTICDPSWIEGCNRMNLILASSNHSKNVFLNSKFEKRDNNTGTTMGKIELTTPCEVLFEGCDTTKYFKFDGFGGNLEGTLWESLDSIEEDFSFLYVGHWLQGELGEDRKNTGMMIKTFLETFKNKKKKPALVLKTCQVNSSIIDREEILKKIDTIRKTVKGDLPNIYLVHGEFEDKEINDLYNHPKIKAMVSLTKGEGYGRPLLEFSVTAKPIIASGWSGHTDFLHPDFTTLVRGEVKQIHPSAVVPNMLIPESGWFTPDYMTVGLIFKDMVENYNDYLEKAKRQAYRSKTEFSLEKMTELLKSYLVKATEKLPKQIELVLPKMSKISLPTKIKI
jgi:hypothetical protein